MTLLAALLTNSVADNPSKAAIASLVLIGFVYAALEGYRAIASASDASIIQAYPGEKHAKQLDDAAALLADLVGRQWTEEDRRREENASEPLRVRWSSTVRPVAAAPSAVVGQAISGRAVRLHLHGEFKDIAATYRQLPRHQLVILGAPGAGKTVLATRLLLDLLHNRQPGDPVPVLFAMSTWNPNRDKPYEWMAAQLADSYPGLEDSSKYGEEAPCELLKTKRVIPVLDGLDEMQKTWQRTALDALGAKLGVRPVVLTCRSQEYEGAVTGGPVPLSYAAVVEVEPPAKVDILRYLPDDPRWRQLGTYLQSNPDGQLAEALTTPLMIDLMIAVYADRKSNPAEMLDGERFADHTAIEQHLLGAFVTAAYRRSPRGRYQAEQARRWLSFLARSLHRRGVRELEWWRIAEAVPRWLISVTVAAPILIVATIAMLYVRDSPPAFASVGAVGIAVATVLGRRAGQTADRPRSVVRGVAGDLIAVVGAVSLGGAALLATVYLVDRSVAIELSYYIVDWIRQMPDGSNYISHLLLPADLLITAIAIPSLLAARYGGTPRRGLPRIGRLFRSLGIGLAAGIVVTSPAITFGIVGHQGKVAGAETWLASSVYIAVLFGVTVGLGSWLAAPIDAQASNEPKSVLAGDRRTLLISTAVTAAPMAVLLPGLGAISGIFVLFGSGSAWLTYSIARGWLAVRGKLPWRLTSFLFDARERRVLRQIGPAYQFTHALLQDQLAGHEPLHLVDTVAHFQPARAQPSRRSVRLLASAFILSLAALTSMVSLVYLHTEHRFRIIDGTGSVWFMALGPGGHELATISADDHRRIAIRNLDTGRIVYARFAAADAPDPLTFPMDSPEAIPPWQDFPIALAFSADGDTLIAAKGNGTILRWRTSTGENISMPSPALRGVDGIRGVGLSGDGRLLIAAMPSSNHEAVVWSQNAAGKLEPSKKFSFKNDVSLRPVAAFPSKGSPVIALAESNRVTVWHPGSTQPLVALGQPSWDYISALALSPDGTVLAEIRSTADNTGHALAGDVHLWNVKDGHEMTSPVPRIDTFRTLAFSPDGRSIAVGNDHEVQIWPTTGL
ncbi:NACHT and WD40 repeat domain-containing protein [Cryptosporangium phraense]|uniref:NACHT and WD40 repeat domain-containing protein n=1 Tax=Cryptosporangium phraense TaxID=2593070 RepID=UPI0014792D2C|nr:WD40 repeat domain-containing protein [Cryptosporangium phraense]